MTEVVKQALEEVLRAGPHQQNEPREAGKKKQRKEAKAAASAAEPTDEAEGDRLH